STTRPIARLDDRRVRRSWGLRGEGPSASTGRSGPRCPAPPVRCAGLLAPRSARSKPETLITLLDEMQALRIAVISLAEGIDATTPAGKLQMHILGAIAEFERERIREHVLAGLQGARTQGKRLGRPHVRPPVKRLQRVAGLPAHIAAARLGVSRS